MTRLVAFVVVALVLWVAPAARATPCDYTTRIVNVPIPNGPAMSTGVASAVWVPPAMSPDAIEDVNVGVSVVTPDPKDLTISVAHAGTSVTLTGRHGAGAATTFDDEAAAPINGATAPFAGSFRPDKPLSALDGASATGVWTLTVKDTESPLSPGRHRDAPQTFVTWTLSYASSQCAFDLPPCDEHGNTFDTPVPSTVSGLATTSGVLGKGFVTGVQITVHGYTVSAPSTVSFAVGRSGSGTKRKLITGASVTTGAAFTETAFDDAATAGIASGAQPYTGRFKPEEALSAFNGAPVSSRYSFELSRTGSAPASLGPWGLRVLTAGCVDTDGDAVFDTSDNCEAAANVDQANYEFDALGDVCDDDDDDDGVADATDACPRGLRSFDPGGDATDYEGDGCRDTEDADDDNDGVPDAADGCPQAAKGPGGDTDGDGCKDFEDADDDNDGVMDSMDRCPLASDPAQTDTDADGTGDACDADDDGDGVIDGADAFPLDPSRSAPSAEPTPSPSPSATPVRSAPRITRLRLSRKRIAAGRRAKVRYTVSAAATTRFTVLSVKRCGKRKGCKPLTARRRFRRMNTAGAVTVVLRTKGLRTGRYRLRLIPSNTDGPGEAATVAFRVR